MDADLNYYRRRSAEERAAAASARDSKVRDVHLELALAYEKRSATLEARSAVHGLQLVSAV